MTTRPPGTFIETPDGRVLFTNPSDEGPRVVERDLPGEAGEILRAAFYKARVVIERVDGGAIEAGDSAFIEAVLRALGEATARGDVRHAVTAEHFRGVLPQAASKPKDDAAE